MKLLPIRLLFLISVFVATILPSASTNAVYTSQASSLDNTFATTCWTPPSVPVLVSPANNTIAGIGSPWVTNPLMDWQDSTTTCPLPTTFTYQYESYHSYDPGTVTLSGLAYSSAWLSSSQIPAPGTPDGVYYWHVRARDSFGHISSWSAPWKLTVDTRAPIVKIDSPADGLIITGPTDIRATVTDQNPHHYWFVIQDSGGATIAGPGTVNRDTSFTNQVIFSWDPTSLPDGQYTFKLEARDAAGNKDPNLAPVLADPEVPSDSVDWISVTLDQSPPTSSITDASTTLVDRLFDINYQADDHIDFVGLCYSLNLGPFICPPALRDTPNSPGVFHFSAPDDGVYRFFTVAHDLAGRIEDSNSDGFGDDTSPDQIQLVGSSHSGLLEIVLDSTAPTTIINPLSYSGQTTWSGQNLLVNPDFEHGQDGWQAQGDGDHHLVSSGVDLDGYSFTPASGDNMFLLGFLDHPAILPSTDSLFQEFVLDPHLTSYFDFSYRLLSQDIIDFDHFFVELQDSAGSLLDRILLTGSGGFGPDSWTGDTGWRQVLSPLNSAGQSLVRITLGVSSSDTADLRTWAYVDNLAVRTLDTRLSQPVDINFESHDLGTGVASSPSPASLTGGENQLSYQSTDIAGNTEADNTASFLVSSLTLNRLHLNLVGDSSVDVGSLADPQSGESIEIINNSTADISLSGFYFKNSADQTLPIPAATLSTGQTLVVFRAGAAFNLADDQDTISLFDASNLLIDKYHYQIDTPADGQYYYRTPSGLGSWALASPAPPSLDFNLVSRLAVHKLTLTVFNIPDNFGQDPSDLLNYEIIYTDTVGEQGIFGQITPTSVVDRQSDRDLLLGTCSSGGVCVYNTNVGPTATVNITGQIDGSPVLLNRLFTIN